MSEFFTVKQSHSLTIFAIVLAVVSISAWLSRDRRLDKLPGPKGYPLIGIGISLPPKATTRLREWGSMYGEVFKMRVGWYNWVVINSPQAFRDILDKQVRMHTPGRAIWRLKTLTSVWSLVHNHFFQNTSPYGGRCGYRWYATVYDAVRT